MKELVITNSVEGVFLALTKNSDLVYVSHRIYPFEVLDVSILKEKYPELKIFRIRSDYIQKNILIEFLLLKLKLTNVVYIFNKLSSVNIDKSYYDSITYVNIPIRNNVDKINIYEFSKSDLTNNLLINNETMFYSKNKSCVLFTKDMIENFVLIDYILSIFPKKIESLCDVSVRNLYTRISLARDYKNYLTNKTVFGMITKA